MDGERMKSLKIGLQREFVPAISQPRHIGQYVKIATATTCKSLSAASLQIVYQPKPIRPICYISAIVLILEIANHMASIMVKAFSHQGKGLAMDTHVDCISLNLPFNQLFDEDDENNDLSFALTKKVFSHQEKGLGSNINESCTHFHMHSDLSNYVKKKSWHLCA